MALFYRQVVALLSIVISASICSCSRTEVLSSAPLVSNNYTQSPGTLECVIGSTPFKVSARELVNQNEIQEGVSAFRVGGNNILIVANDTFNRRPERMQILFREVNFTAPNRLDSLRITEPGQLKNFAFAYALFGNNQMIMTTDAPDSGNTIVIDGTIGISEIKDEKFVSGRFNYTQVYNGQRLSINNGSFYQIPLK